MNRRSKLWEPKDVEYELILVSVEEHRKRLAELSEIIYSLLRKSRKLTVSKSNFDLALEAEPCGSSKKGAA